MKRLYISRIEGDLLHFRIFHFGFDKIGKLLKDEIKQGLTGWLHQLEEFLKEEGVTAIQEIPVICFGISTFKMMSWAGN